MSEGEKEERASGRHKQYRRSNMWLGAIILWTSLRLGSTLPVPDGELDTSTRLLGSSVVTSVSVVMQGQKGSGGAGMDTTFDGRRVAVAPIKELPASPAGLLRPDRFQFYTFDNRGDVITKQMTEEEIQSLIAAGGGLLPTETHGPQKAEDVPTGGTKAQSQVADVVQNVQNVLKGELNKSTLVMGTISTIPGHASAEWSNILPAILTGGDVAVAVAAAAAAPPSNPRPCEDVDEEASIIETAGSSLGTPEVRPETVDAYAANQIDADEAASGNVLRNATVFGPDNASPPGVKDDDGAIPTGQPDVILSQDNGELVEEEERPMIQVPIITVDDNFESTKQPSPGPVFHILNTLSVGEAVSTAQNASKLGGDDKEEHDTIVTHDDKTELSNGSTEPKPETSGSSSGDRVDENGAGSSHARPVSTNAVTPETTGTEFDATTSPETEISARPTTPVPPAPEAEASLSLAPPPIGQDSSASQDVRTTTVGSAAVGASTIQISETSEIPFQLAKMPVKIDSDPPESGTASPEDNETETTFPTYTPVNVEKIGASQAPAETDPKVETMPEALTVEAITIIREETLSERPSAGSGVTTQTVRPDISNVSSTDRYVANDTPKVDLERSTPLPDELAESSFSTMSQVSGAAASAPQDLASGGSSSSSTLAPVSDTTTQAAKFATVDAHDHRSTVVAYGTDASHVEMTDGPGLNEAVSSASETSQVEPNANSKPDTTTQDANVFDTKTQGPSTELGATPYHPLVSNVIDPLGSPRPPSAEGESEASSVRTNATTHQLEASSTTLRPAEILPNDSELSATGDVVSGSEASTVRIGSTPTSIDSTSMTRTTGIINEDPTESPVIGVQLTDVISIISQMLENSPAQVGTPSLETLTLPTNGYADVGNVASSLIAGFATTTTTTTNVELNVDGTFSASNLTSGSHTANPKDDEEETIPAQRTGEEFERDKEMTTRKNAEIDRNTARPSPAVNTVFVGTIGNVSSDTRKVIANDQTAAVVTDNGPPFVEIKVAYNSTRNNDSTTTDRVRVTENSESAGTTADTSRNDPSSSESLATKAEDDRSESESSTLAETPPVSASTVETIVQSYGTNSADAAAMSVTVQSDAQQKRKPEADASDSVEGIEAESSPTQSSSSSSSSGTGEEVEEDIEATSSFDAIIDAIKVEGLDVSERTLPTTSTELAEPTKIRLEADTVPHRANETSSGRPIVNGTDVEPEEATTRLEFTIQNVTGKPSTAAEKQEASSSSQFSLPEGGGATTIGTAEAILRKAQETNRIRVNDSAVLIVRHPALEATRITKDPNRTTEIGSNDNKENALERDEVTGQSLDGSARVPVVTWPTSPTSDDNPSTEMVGGEKSGDGASGPPSPGETVSYVKLGEVAPKDSGIESTVRSENDETTTVGSHEEGNVNNNGTYAELDEMGGNVHKGRPSSEGTIRVPSTGGHVDGETSIRETEAYAKLGETTTSIRPLAADGTLAGGQPQSGTSASAADDERTSPSPSNDRAPVGATEETPVALEASQSASGLDGSVRNLDRDIVLFSSLCNQLAFSFWSATNEGLSTLRSLALSPFGMTSMLAMVFLGARGPTSDQMNDVLKLDDVVTFNPHLVFQNVTDTVSLARNDQGIANAAFVRELFADKTKIGKLMPFYKEQAQQFYEGFVGEVNFAAISDVVRRRTNLLVRKQTGGRIKDFVKGNTVPLRSPLAAISANVFQTSCDSGAASSDGRDGELYFAVSPARVRQRRLIPISATVWRSGVLAGYEPGLDATAIALGGAEKLVSTVFVVPGQQGHAAPGDSLDRLEQRLIRGEGPFGQGSWDKLLKVLVPRSGLELQIPKFSHRSVVNATAALKRMGLEQLFSKHANLKGINSIGNDLHLADMLQLNLFGTCGDETVASGRHHVEVYPASSIRNVRKLSEAKETRTMAAAAAAAAADNAARDSSRRVDHERFNSGREEDARGASRKGRAAPSSMRPRLKLDRPFLYFVRHNPTGLILHMGRFNPRLLT